MYQIKKIFLNFLLFLQNIFVKKPKTDSNNIFSSGNKKSVINQAASLEIKNKNEELIKEVKNKATELVKEHYGDIDKTIALLESKNIRIYRINNASKILKYANEKIGFISPLTGMKAVYINFITSLLCDKKIVFNGKSEAMFIFSTKEIDKFFLASQIYKFAAYKNNLAGFEFEEQEKFKKLYKTPSTASFEKLTAGDIFAIKEVLARETEAADFALALAQEEESKENL